MRVYEGVDPTRVCVLYGLHHDRDFKIYSLGSGHRDPSMCGGEDAARAWNLEDRLCTQREKGILRGGGSSREWDLGIYSGDLARLPGTRTTTSAPSLISLRPLTWDGFGSDRENAGEKRE